MFCFRTFFSFLISRFHRGDVLITTATGVMTEEEGDRWGLVPTHAYAVLDIREYKVTTQEGGRGLDLMMRSLNQSETAAKTSPCSPGIKKSNRVESTARLSFTHQCKSVK